MFPPGGAHLLARDRDVAERLHRDAASVVVGETAPLMLARRFVEKVLQLGVDAGVRLAGVN